MKKIIFILVIFACIYDSCKKYEEGPLISFLSSENRFYGNHTLVKYTVNSIDSLSLFNDSLPLVFHFYFNDYDNNNQCDILGLRKDGKYSGLCFGWDLINKNKIFEIFTSSGSMGTGPFGHLKKSEWNILKLCKRDIRMKTEYNGKEYFIELK
jgi:hypothetical protein